MVLPRSDIMLNHWAVKALPSHRRVFRKFGSLALWKSGVSSKLLVVLKVDKIRQNLKKHLADGEEIGGVLS